jgi:hypothetical protein
MEDHLDHQALEALIGDCARRLRAWWQARWGGGDADPLGDISDFDLDEQLVRSSFPLRVPLALEIYVDGAWVCMRESAPNQPPRARHRRIVNVSVPLERMEVRDILLRHLKRPYPGQELAPRSLYLLAMTHRPSFLAAAAQHFVDVLARGRCHLAGDRWFGLRLAELCELDETIVVEMVERAMLVSRAAGRQLRDAVSEAIDQPSLREGIGWLVTAALTERLEAL